MMQIALVCNLQLIFEHKQKSKDSRTSVKKNKKKNLLYYLKLSRNYARL